MERLLTVDQLKDRFEQAGSTLLMMRAQGLFPQGHKAAWPEILQQQADIFAAIVGSENPYEKAQEIEEARNRIRMQPTARQVQELDQALEWLWLVEGIKRKLVFARMLVHPVTEKNIISFRKLEAVLGNHRDTIKRWHHDALRQIATQITASQISQNMASSRVA